MESSLRTHPKKKNRVHLFCTRGIPPPPLRSKPFPRESASRSRGSVVEVAAVGNNVAHYRQALEWPVADRWVFCRIPVAPSTNTGRGKSIHYGSLLLLGYSRTVSWLAVPRRLLTRHLVRRWVCQGPKEVPPPQEFLVAKVNALESSRGETEPSLRASSCSWRISFLESTIAFLQRAPSNSISFWSFHRDC